MDRRTYLVTAGIGTSFLLAGCLSDGPSDDESDVDETDLDNDESEPENEPTPEQVIGAYLEAAQAEDSDAMVEVVHSASPLRDLLTDPEWEFESDGSADLDALETETVTADGSVEDVRGLEGAAFWFEDDDLEDEIGDEEITLVHAELDGEESTGQTGVYALVTEDDEWRIFWVGSEDDTPRILRRRSNPKSSTPTTMSSNGSSGASTRWTPPREPTSKPGTSPASTSPTRPASRPT